MSWGANAPAVDPGLVQKKCWRWDPSSEWPPFSVHRDIREPIERCSDEWSRDVQWGNEFRQSILPKGAVDPTHQNDDTCPRISVNTDWGWEAQLEIDDGANCMDGTLDTADQKCELGTNMRSCGVHANLAVFGYAYRQHLPPNLDDGKTQCIQLSDGSRLRKPADSGCWDGGPGSIADPAICYYGTDTACGRRRFAFKPEKAGPDTPDDSCTTALDGECTDGLMWSKLPPGKNTCAPNTDVRAASTLHSPPSTQHPAPSTQHPTTTTGS